MTEPKVIAGLIEAVNASQTKPVFVHELSGQRAWWHYGECFPDVDTCAVPHAADIDAEAH